MEINTKRHMGVALVARGDELAWLYLLTSVTSPDQGAYQSLLSWGFRGRCTYTGA